MGYPVGTVIIGVGLVLFAGAQHTLSQTSLSANTMPGPDEIKWQPLRLVDPRIAAAWVCDLTPPLDLSHDLYAESAALQII